MSFELQLIILARSLLDQVVQAFYTGAGEQVSYRILTSHPIHDPIHFAS